MDLKATYNKIAEDWQNDHTSDDWWVDSVNKFILLLEKGDKVLDVGCGSGNGAQYLIERGLKVIGIDLSDGMIKIAKVQNPTGQFFVMDMADIEQVEGEFDGIFVKASLLHIPKKEVENILQKIISKLKKGGYIYIAVKEKRDDGVEEEIKKENDYGYEYERFFSYFTTDEIKKYFYNLNLEIVHQAVATHGKTNWISVIGKK